jgi:UDP-N-acetylmuramoylalanine--D-glutamate ligase
MGGRFKGGRFEDLRQVLGSRATAVVAIGEARPLLARALSSIVPVHEASSMDDAVALAFGLARPDGVVLLAPACASFDQFENYAARGRAFKAAVGRLVGASGEAGNDRMGRHT